MQIPVEDAVVAFLRQWLPDSAKATYRDLINRDPENWHRDPHFAGDLVVKHFLRGNGIDEKMMGVPDLCAVWPRLLHRAVMGVDEES